VVVFLICRICNNVQYFAVFLLSGCRVSDTSVSSDVLRLVMFPPLFLHVSFSRCTDAEFQTNRKFSGKIYMGNVHIGYSYCFAGIVVTQRHVRRSAAA
jgi:hypothetical protein